MRLPERKWKESRRKTEEGEGRGKELDAGRLWPVGALASPLLALEDVKWKGE